MIVLDPGHNGGNASHPREVNALVPAGGFSKPCNTTGTQDASGYREHAFNWTVASQAAVLLSALGAEVVLTRPDDSGVGPCVNTRAEIANRKDATLTISIHADGGPVAGSGFHVIAPGLAPDGGNRGILGESLRLAETLRAKFQEQTGEPLSSYAGTAGLDVRSDLAGLNLARVPAVLLECGNMRNAKDAARLRSIEFQARAAEGIAAAASSFLAGRDN